MPLIRLSNPLIFPSRKPGFDPSHPAAQNPRLSLVAAQANFLNIGGLGGQPATANISAAVPKSIGPIVDFGNAGGSQKVTVANLSTATDVAFTAAAIIVVRTIIAAAQQLLTNSNTGTAPFAFRITASTGTLNLNVNGTNSVFASPALIVGVPYLVAASRTSNNINFLISRLDTGQVYTGAVANAGTSAGGNGTYCIGNGVAGGVSCFSYMAAAMASATYLSIPKLLAWGADPWSYWYPRAVENLIMSSLKTPAAAATLVQRRTASLIGTRTGSRQMII